MTQTLQKESADATGPFLEKFNRFESGAKSSLLPLRKAGLARFAELGFPTLHDEDWRFTNVAPLAKLPFKPMFEMPAVNGAETKALNEFAFTKLAGTRLVFVNGHYSPKLSSVEKLPAGAKAGSLAAALNSDAALVEKYLGRCTPATNNAFTELNQAFFLDGAFVHVPDGADVKTPIQLVYICSANEIGDTVQPRNLIVAGADSRLTIVESYIATTDTTYFTN
ncbi:MAG TPA: Fe-S cluster assembly protein SufD, partial [Verrucomicrobiae bacterium]